MRNDDAHLVDDVLVVQGLERDGSLARLVRQRHPDQVLQGQQLADLHQQGCT